MKKHQHLFSILLLSFLAMTCHEKEKLNEYPDLRIYLDRFEEEAAKRGYDFDLSDVQAIYVEEINKQGTVYCGYGYPNFDGNGLRRVEISKSCQWQTLTDIERECFIFHEIGHAFLNRVHDVTELCDGSALTLMNPVPYEIYHEHEETKRDYYLSELFDKLAVLGKCISYDKDWRIDPIYYAYTAEDKQWIFYSSKGKYTSKKGDAISISSADNSTTENGYWYRQFSSPNIPQCAEVKLKVTLNADNLSGKGAGIAIRLYDDPVGQKGAQDNQFLFLTTEDNPVSGKLTELTQELVIPCFTRETNYLIVFVALRDGTSGEVSFKDIRLEVKPQ